MSTGTPAGTDSQALDLRAAQAQVGQRVVEVSDTLDVQPVAVFQDTFDPHPQEAPRPGSPLPPGLHCLYFLRPPPKALLRPDGTPQDNGLVPPIELPRRMFASEELHFHRPLRLGETLTQRSELFEVRQRPGRSGPLVFATVRHRIGDALTSLQHTVFRGAAGEGGGEAAAPGALPEPQWVERRRLDAVDLFRFSALTLNSHRIHYDLQWAREREGYPQLVVQGQLVSQLLLGFALRHCPGALPVRYQMRAQAPLFCMDDLELCGVPTGSGCELWAVARATVVMRAQLSVQGTAPVPPGGR